MIWCMVGSFGISLFLTPVVRMIAIKFNIMDHPSSKIKSHVLPTPYLGGIAIMLGMMIIMLVYLFIKGSGEFLPWQIFISLFSIFALGSLDDVVGFSAQFRFLAQFIIYAWFIYSTGLVIPITGQQALDTVFTLFWLVGVTNAFNIIDIMDGLSSGVSILISAFLFFLGASRGLESVKFLSLVTGGAALGFIGYNLSKKLKIFMGDGGSTLLGGALGTGGVLLCQGGSQGVIDFLAILVLFGVPIYDTLLVMLLRIRKGVSPFKGSRDHFALRMVKMGFSNVATVICAYIVTISLGLFSVLISSSDLLHACLLLFAISLLAIAWGRMLSIVDI